MQRLVFLFLILALISCSNGSGEMEIAEDSVVVPPPMITIEEEAPVEQTATPEATPAATAVEPTVTQEPELQWDLSGVILFEATHLMDPAHFQISLDNWPEDLPEETRVLVDEEEFNCEILFPDQFPRRVYCWGAAPGRGDEVTIRVFLAEAIAPVLEIPFVVPAPGGG